MEKQLNLNLNDKLQKFKIIAEKMVKEYKNSSTSVRIFAGKDEDTYWLGTRTFIYDTEYTHDYKIDWETAKYLYEVVGIWDFMDRVKERLQKEKEEQLKIVCPICGCIKENKGDLIDHHKSTC